MHAAVQSDQAPTEEISGTVQNVVYRNEETGYTVCALLTDSGRGLATVVGSTAALWEGEELRALGRWIRHPQHGVQFQADQLTCIAPSSRDGILRYLSSGMIKGIGKVNAKRLVDHFGDLTLHIIEKESQRLQEVEGIGPTRRKLIKESWNAQKGIRDIMIFLQSHGIGRAQAARIYREYGHEAIALVKQNPYRLCNDIWGIGFKTADGVAQSVGIPHDSVVRARAGLLYTLQTLSDEGHCFCPEPELLLLAEELLGISVEILAEGLKTELDRKTLIRDDARIYLAPLHEAETTVAQRLRVLLQSEAHFRPIAADKAVDWAAQQEHISFAPAQREALHVSLTEKVSVMTGGPGVGKTTIIRALTVVFGVRRLNVQLAAPTGRAAKRMSEATGCEARTIHRLLKYIPGKHTFEYNRENRLEGDVFILDECSMIDIRLMQQLLDALPDHAWLVLVGDIDQLPSVGPGNVLRDIIRSKAVPCTALTTIFRQDSGGLIVRNAHLINQGEQLELPEGRGNSDFYFINAQEPDVVIEKLRELVTHRIPRKFHFDPMTDVQVLSPMRRNQLGAENLNIVLQEALNPSGREMQRFGRAYRQGDRVMQIRNNYDKEVFNGDIGRICAIDNEEGVLTVDYDGTQVKYETNELDELVHAYASTIHKSQGSEYPCVIVVITTQHFKLLQRNLLYTAVTRGRKLVCLVGSHKAIGIAIRNNEIHLRQTALAERLRGRLES